ncbi:alpha-L-arabinofuranosidase [Cutibacterium acnes P07A]|nr:alpha-L-arabinofuranosidase [Cutibacterium acnes P07A]
MGHKTPEEYARAVTEVANTFHRFDDNPIVATCGSSGRSMPIFGRRERVVADAAFDSLDLVSATPTTNPIDDDFIRLGVVAVGRTRIVVHRDSDPRTNLSC